MNNADIIKATEGYIKDVLQDHESSHDWWHIERVWKNAQRIGEAERADMLIVELAALLHDVADWKFHDGDLTAGPRKVREFLSSHNIAPKIVDDVASAVETVSFKGVGVAVEPKTLEGKVVQDADRLDAIGAIGIARAFAYGGHANRAMHDPTEKIAYHDSFEEYKNSRGTTINHFHEKLLLLKDLMHTNTAKQIAEGRHQFMLDFLEEFHAEWESKS